MVTISWKLGGFSKLNEFRNIINCLYIEGCCVLLCYGLSISLHYFLKFVIFTYSYEVEFMSHKSMSAFTGYEAG